MKSPFLRRFGMPSPFFDNEAGFSPTVLLLGSTALVWLDPSDLTTLFQDAAGTTPVTAPGQPVGLALDKSQGLVLGPELVTNGAFTTDTAWTKGTNWTISGGVAAYSGTSTDLLSQNIGAVVGKFYVVEWTSTVFVTIRLGSSGTNAFAGVGNRAIITPSGTDGTLYIRPPLASMSIDNISVRELPGFHATASGTSRPTYGVVPSRGRVNLLTRTEEFNDAVWARLGTTVTANSAVAPDGTTTADSLFNTANFLGHYARQNLTVPSGDLTATYYVKYVNWPRVAVRVFDGVTGTRWATYNIQTGAVLAASAGVTASIAAVGNDWYRITHTTTGVSGSGFSEIHLANSDAYTGATYTGVATDQVLIWGAQAELGSTASPYQRVASQFEVTDPVGFPTYPCHYLQFDGVDDFMQTPTITPNADKVQVFAGVRKLSDAAASIVIESSTTVETNAGSIIVFTNPNTYGTKMRGSLNPLAVVSPTNYAAPITNVLAAIGDIEGDLNTLRVNGTQVAQSTADQGTGNFLAYPLFIGRRGGTTLPFNGQLFSLIVRFSTANLDAGLISQTERWVAGKTGLPWAEITSPTIYDRFLSPVLDRFNETIERRAV